MHKKIWPIIVSLSSASIMVLSFFVPSIQDQWDRFQSRKVIEQYAGLGDEFFAEERYDMAEKAYQKAFEISEQKRLDIDVKRLNAKINRVTMEPDWGTKPPEDIEEIDFQYVLHMQNHNKFSKQRSVTLNSYGIFLSSLHRYKEAEKAFAEAIKLDSTNVLFFGNLGNVYDNLGKKELAYKNYRKAILLDPENARAHYNLGLLFVEQKKFEEAEKEFKAALKTEPEDTDILRESKLVRDELDRKK